MIIVNMQGGLGNQMFQYAAARAISYNDLICFDLNFLSKHKLSNENFTARNYELRIFKNLEKISVNQKLIKLATTENKKLSFFKLFLPQKLKNITFVGDTNFSLNLHRKGNIYLNGYFQNARYYVNIRNELLQAFEFPKLPNYLDSILTEMENTNAVSIHIRRADYLKSNIIKHHGILPVKYYEDAISKIKDKIENPIFYVFSDDISWCKENLKALEVNIIFMENQNSPTWVDMCLMSKCNHHIIANSSFSWWGAWLCKREDKIVIAPKKWFINTETEIIPSKWIRC